MGAKASEIQTKIERPEIFFALIGAAGTDLARVETELTRALAGVGYRTEAIRVSALIAAWAGRAAQPWADEAERLTYLMNEGDRMRKESGDGGALMSLVCSDIKSRRIRVHQGQQAGRAQDHEQSDIVDLGNTPVAATAYIIRSLKHPHEATVLRQTIDRLRQAQQGNIPLSTAAQLRDPTIARLEQGSRSRNGANWYDFDQNQARAVSGQFDLASCQPD